MLKKLKMRILLSDKILFCKKDFEVDHKKLLPIIPAIEWLPPMFQTRMCED